MIEYCNTLTVNYLCVDWLCLGHSFTVTDNGSISKGTDSRRIKRCWGLELEVRWLTHLFKGFMCIFHLCAGCQLCKGRTGTIWCTSVATAQCLLSLNCLAILTPALYITDLFPELNCKPFEGRDPLSKCLSQNPSWKALGTMVDLIMTSSFSLFPHDRNLSKTPICSLGAVQLLW